MTDSENHGEDTLTREMISALAAVVRGQRGRVRLLDICAAKGTNTYKAF